MFMMRSDAVAWFSLIGARFSWDECVYLLMAVSLILANACPNDD
jgi:hypothetical protein